MKVDLICGICLKGLHEKGVNNLSYSDNIPTPVNELSDNGVYQVICHKGHQSGVILDNQKFELLFELGLNAIVDGYYRDAVTSITSSLERFYEFFIKVIWRKNGIDFLEIEKIWKNIGNQSERQFGAFIALYTSEKKELPPILNVQSETKFRNDVVHKGYIPKKAEAVKYAEAVLNLIETPLLFLKQVAEESVIETFNYYSPVRRARENNKIDDDLFITNILPTIDVVHGRCDYRLGNVSHQLNRIEKDRLPKKMHLYEKLLPANVHPTDVDIVKAEECISEAEQLELKGKLVEALILFDKSISHVKYNYAAIKGKIRIGIIQKKKIEEMKSIIEDFIELGPTNPTVCNDIMSLFFESDRIDDAISILKSAESKYENDSEAIGNFNFYLGTIMRLLNRKDEALKFFLVAKKAFHKSLSKDHEVFDVIKSNIDLVKVILK
jgi:tetratricopeptide (TPR) repeat protein